MKILYGVADADVVEKNQNMVNGVEINLILPSLVTIIPHTFFQIIQPLLKLVIKVLGDHRSHQAGDGPWKLTAVLPGDFSFAAITPWFKQPIVFGFAFPGF